MKPIHQLSKEDRARYLGNPDQMYSVRRVSIEDGRAKNTTEYEVTTGGGLSYSVLADNGLDVGSLSYRGVNMNYVTKNGETSPYLAETYEELRFVTLFYKDSLEGKYGKGIWDDPATAEKYRAELEELVMENLNENYVVLSTCENLGIPTKSSDPKRSIRNGWMSTG